MRFCLFSKWQSIQTICLESQIEEIDNSTTNNPDCIDEAMTEVNLMEGDSVKHEPKNDYESLDAAKISDGIDHSGLC